MKLNPNYGTMNDTLWARMLEDGYEAPNVFMDIIYKFKSRLNFDNTHTFLETGSFYGHTTEVAAFHFDNVFSVEMYTDDKTDTFDSRVGKYTWNKKERLDWLMSAYKNVKVNYTDSVSGLKEYFKDNKDERCLILLDAHNGFESPLTEELKVIRDESNVNNHIILIDDMIDIGKGNWPSYTEFEQLIKDINPNYSIINTKCCRDVYLIY